MTLHEQAGLRIWKNQNNGFVVARLHFTADPKKRGEAWLRESQRGMTNAKWRQEFDIDYSAQQGEKAFPEIQSRREEIVTREGPYIDGVWPSHLPMWAGFDYGARNPSSFHVYTVVDGVTWAIWELYEPCKNLVTFAEKLKSCPYWSQIKYIVHDPDITNLKTHNKNGEPVSIRSHFEQLGILKWVKGNNNEGAWLAVMAKHWCGPEVTFRILETCPMLISEFEGATFKTVTDRQLETQNYNESLVDKRNHALDDCKYFMNSGIAKEKRKVVRYPSLVDSYAWNSKPRQIVRNGELLIGVGH